ncbi:cytidylyltransferase [Xylogone sp. PMI_703]|nr:cytidylyltransferase [Xylogone sp. PMI_703]
MPGFLEPPAQHQSHAQTLREEPLRRLSRSPHPYHRQHFEIPYASERLLADRRPAFLPRTGQTSSDGDREGSPQYQSDRYRESTNSDSGTEADDEQFLKRLPAPRRRPHKGLRGEDGRLSGASTPAILDEELPKSLQGLPKASQLSLSLQEVESGKAAAKLRQKRRLEIARRSTETGLLLFVGSILVSEDDVKRVIQLWSRELAYQFLVISALLVLYPLRLIFSLSTGGNSPKRVSLYIPVSFDPAPLLYPPAITMFVSMLLSIDKPATLLASIILSISSLPEQLIPSFGDTGGSSIVHWCISCVPLMANVQVENVNYSKATNYASNPEILVLLHPMHEALCATLHYLTTTSLLPAELQLLSVALIHLLLFASSPQAVILAVILWVGGLGVFITCGHVLRWGVILARVPKWRFKQEIPSRTYTGLFPFWPFNRVRSSTRNSFLDNSSDDSDSRPLITSKSRSKTMKIKTQDRNAPNGVDSYVGDKISDIDTTSKDRPGASLGIERRHTFSGPSSHSKREKTTSKGRRRRATSGLSSFFSLTQSQANFRKWLYAAFVYAWVAIIALVIIREIAGRYALGGNEPVGWALGYMLGDIQRFRMEVVTTNLQQWICLPPLSEPDGKESCYLGWVEHLRHSSFGTANTRLIISAYWLGIIIVGLAVVFRLSAIYEVDTRRKVFHFMMVAMFLPATYVDPTFAAFALILVLALFLLLDLFRASQLPPLSKPLAYFLAPYVDGRDLRGPVVISHIFLLIGCAIPLWLSLGTLPRTGEGCLEGWEVPTREVSMVSGVICVGLGDAAASLIGRRYGRHKWLWGGGKSIEGSVAFATAVGLALLLAKAWLRIGRWPANNNDAWIMTTGKAGIAATMASMTEAVLTGGNDNVVVPIVLWLCVKGLDL